MHNFNSMVRVTLPVNDEIEACLFNYIVKSLSAHLQSNMETGRAEDYFDGWNIQ